MLQPRSIAVVLVALFLFDNTISGDRINSSPRKRRQDAQDVTTVLLVDSHGRSTFGRFLSVKPDLGLLTSTARTFIQEGVTTEYATQVLGTTLDNGRLYAHLLTKSSRVLYDNEPTRSYENPKKWTIDNNLISKAHFVKNTDYITPNQVDNPFVVFPTSTPDLYKFVEKQRIEQNNGIKSDLSEEELLSEPSNNPRVPFDREVSKKESRVFSVSSSSGQNNVKLFKISPHLRNGNIPYNYKDISEENDVIRKDEQFSPSKVREWDNLPTFTVRNEFSPSGFSFLGDLPDFDVNTERSKQTTAAERRAKLLFRGGIPSKQDLKTITYTGFADFTTTVADTVIVFTPQTVEVPKEGHVTKISGDATIRPTLTLKEPPIVTKVKTFYTHDPGVVTETVEGHKFNMQTILPTMLIDAINRKPKKENLDELLPRQVPTPNLETSALNINKDSTIVFAPDVIQPSEIQNPMLSTPSDEDIAKIFASLQAKAAQQPTEPLNTPSTIFFDNQITRANTGGATTIFFEDELTVPSTIPPTTATVKDSITEATTEEEIPLKHTTENIVITTHEYETTTNEIASTTELDVTTTEQDTDKIEAEEEFYCTDGVQVIPTTVYKTLTYLTTYFIPIDESTSTSIKSNEIVSTEIDLKTRLCNEINTSDLTTQQAADVTTTNGPTTMDNIEEETTQPLTFETTTELEPTTEQITTTEQGTTENHLIETTPMEITTERRHVTESESETTEVTTEGGEEIELIFKTLYTTYTYLTTYFQESSSSIASRKVVVTNVVSSTIDPTTQMTDEAVAGLLGNDFKTRPISFEDFAEIVPSGVGIGRPTSTNVVDNVNDNIQETYNTRPTPALGDENIIQTANAIKTYYTTYTYFTTIFVDGETEISSRTEVYTNFVTPVINPSSLSGNILPTVAPSSNINDDNTDVKNRKMVLNITPSNSYNSTINRNKLHQSVSDQLDNNIIVTSARSPSYNTLQRGTTESSENELLDLSEYETISTMVTDVRSSTSEGDRRIIDNIDKRNLLDDQIVSESNNESEIIPSPTLLLQTSYTTFTYFTTMYQGTTASNVVSRLETITNVVTETLTPTHSLSIEDLSLPITYYTTFTYWTTLYKDGTTKVTSREETLSNIVTPTPIVTSIPPTIKIEASSATQIIDATSSVDIEPSPTVKLDADELTTFYTTFTYYTTSYVGNSTVLNSRLETVTNILNVTNDIESNHIARAIGQGVQNNIEPDVKSKTVAKDDAAIKLTGLLSTVRSTVENSGVQTILSTDIYGTYIDGLYAKVLESTSIIVTPTIEPTTTQENLKPTGVVSINQGKIVDADGISTLIYTTQAIGTYIDNLYAQVIESTSSLKIDEERKAIQTTTPVAHRTGLVRLIEGSIIHNKTTTLYQSKVLGTIIDGRYAQIIESTSSFIVDKIQPSVVASNIQITPTSTDTSIGITSTALPISPSPVVIEGSISDTTKIDEENVTEDDDEDDSNEDDEDDGSSRVKSRLTFQSRKRTFTPVIRPFASRPKPTFAPKRKGAKPSSATTITRSDFTPTVTAIPASKSGSRFGGGRKSSSLPSASISPSSSRRFSRPRSGSASSSGASQSVFTPNRGRSSSRIQPSTAFSSSSRRGGFRSSSISSGSGARSSSSFNPNNRFRIRPTLASPLNRSPNSNAVTLPTTISDEENDLTTLVTEGIKTNDDIETTDPTTTIETSRRSQNPLLRFRRPPVSRPSTTARSISTKSLNNNNNRNNGAIRGSGNRATNGITTTSKPTPRSFNRATSNNAIQNRARPGNSLFPRRNLFTTTTTPEPEEEVEDIVDGGDDNEQEEGDEEDTEYESSNTNSRTEKAPLEQKRVGRANAGGSSSVLIKPFVRFNRRTKRQVNYSRFRRPSTRTTTSAPIVVEELEPETEAPKLTRNRYVPRSRSRPESHTTPAPTRIVPSRVNHGRSQFTLRDTNSNTRTSNFRRPSTARPSIKKPTTRASRLRAQTESTIRKPTSRARNTNKSGSRRGTSRARTNSAEIESNYVQPGFDGTITVTHQIPTEVTIPVVNGKVTEYKNIITAKLSTEVLGSKQYSTSINPYGKEVTVLLSENTGFGGNGNKEITQFILNESPTTAIVFTPTYIRGRKTSFSHVIPSTAYIVEQVVSTITPALPQAPLANILLSQLLLGQQNIGQNHLLGLQNQAVAGTPSTEYKVKTTTYVTTVTSEVSTVIPLTFRGKEILTTIIDSSINVVTATEFITETVIVTPTPILQQNDQLNSLLVPLLLQQQQAQQQASNPIFQNPAGVLNVNDQLFLQNQKSFLEDKQNLDNDPLVDEDYNEQLIDVVTEAPKRKTGRKKPRKPTPPPPETSVITLYISGRTPGEFSTVLSTVVVGEENKKKREATYVPVEASKIVQDLVISSLDYVDSYFNPAIKDVEESETSLETQSLESILGDMTKKRVINSPVVKEIKPTKSTNLSSKKYTNKYSKTQKFESAPFLAL